MLLLFAIMDAPIFVKFVILFLISLVIFTIGIAFERFAILSFQEKASKDFDKEFNSGIMLGGYPWFNRHFQSDSKALKGRVTDICKTPRCSFTIATS